MKARSSHKRFESVDGRRRASVFEDIRIVIELGISIIKGLNVWRVIVVRVAVTAGKLQSVDVRNVRGILQFVEYRRPVQHSRSVNGLEVNLVVAAIPSKLVDFRLLPARAN